MTKKVEVAYIQICLDYHLNDGLCNQNIDDDKQGCAINIDDDKQGGCAIDQKLSQQHLWAPTSFGRTHKTQNRIPTKCNQCRFQYSQVEDLKKHMERSFEPHFVKQAKHPNPN